MHGAGGWDEATPAGPFVRFDVQDGHVRREARDPVDYGVKRCSLDDLRGGDAEHNATRLRAALKGGDTEAHRDALILAAALALEVTGMEPDPRAAGARAREAISQRCRRHSGGSSFDRGRLNARVDSSPQRGTLTNGA
jgi:anthranilate phosphoribosyltransferase